MPAFLTFDSNEVCELVGIGPLLLNKFVERKTYGIQPSVRRGKGRGGRRLFSPDDVLGIALVWWLFESGLRSNVIQTVLDEICRGDRGIADQAAKKLIQKKIRVVRIQTQPRRENPNVKMPRYLIFLIAEEKSNIARPISIVLKIPVGHLYLVLVDKLKKLTGLPEGD
jgi:DNA-binding transcriptional MerR regulator